MKKEKACLAIFVAFALTIQMCYAQRDVKGCSKGRVAAGELTVQFRGINKTGAEIHAFKIEVAKDCKVNIKEVKVRKSNESNGYGDWDVDDDGDGKSQEYLLAPYLYEKDNIDESRGRITRVDRLGNGNEKNPENKKGEAIPKNGEFLIIIKFDKKAEANGTLWIYPYTATKKKDPPWQQIACVGCDPPIYGNIIAFPTPEHFISTDLNSDNDTYDTILRYQNLQTGQITNTGLIASGAHYAIDIFKDIIAFVGQGSQICCYNINTGTVSETGAVGSRLSIYENIIAFSSKGTLKYFDLSTQTLTDTKVFGCSPDIYEDTIVFHVFSPKPTIYVHDLRTGETVDTGAIGKDPTIYETIVAFVALEISVAEDLNGDGDTTDSVICYYNLETQTIVNTGIVGFYPVVHRSQIIFSTSEHDINQDLNGDGKILGQIIRYYDIKTGHLVNTGKLGTEPGVYGDTITFYFWEGWADQDLNGDGDLNDPIVGTYQIIATEIAMAVPISGCF